MIGHLRVKWTPGWSRRLLCLYANANAWELVGVEPWGKCESKATQSRQNYGKLGDTVHAVTWTLEIIIFKDPMFDCSYIKAKLYSVSHGHSKCISVNK